MYDCSFFERGARKNGQTLQQKLEKTESSFFSIVTFPISVNRNATQKQESSISRKVIENSDGKANMQSL